MNKVIFLDIDGVLNSNSWNNSHQKEIIVLDPDGYMLRFSETVECVEE